MLAVSEQPAVRSAEPATAPGEAASAVAPAPAPAAAASPATASATPAATVTAAMSATSAAAVTAAMAAAAAGQDDTRHGGLALVRTGEMEGRERDIGDLFLAEIGAVGRCSPRNRHFRHRSARGRRERHAGDSEDGDCFCRALDARRPFRLRHRRDPPLRPNSCAKLTYFSGRAYRRPDVGYFCSAIRSARGPRAITVQG